MLLAPGLQPYTSGSSWSDGHPLESAASPRPALAAHWPASVRASLCRTPNLWRQLASVQPELEGAASARCGASVRCGQTLPWPSCWEAASEGLHHLHITATHDLRLQDVANLPL